MKSDGLKKNFAYQLIYQIIILVLPLVTAPYLTRVLGDTNLGIYAYTYSIAYYFVIFANLGIARHGQRILSARKDDETSLRKAFWSLYFVHLITSFFGFGAYFIFCYFQQENVEIYLIQSIFVLSALFDITWLFYGLEKFKSVVIKNAIMRIVETVLIFVLIKNKNDLDIYTWIMACSVCFSGLILLPQAISTIKPIRFGWQDIKEHIKPVLILSITIIAISLYTVFDKTLLGIMTTKENVAYYEYADKIIKIPRTILGVMGTVMFPRCCACFAKNDIDGLKKHITTSIEFAFLLGFASVAGLIAVSKLFSVIYYGEDFATTGIIMCYMAPIVFVVAIGDILRVQILIPIHKDLEYTICVVITAVLNIVLTVLLIPIMGVIGAVVGTLAAEIIGLIIQLVLCRKYLYWKKILLLSIPYIIMAIIMFASIELIKVFFNDTLLHLIIQIGTGIAVYSFLLVLWHLCFSPNKLSNRNRIKAFLSKNKNEQIEEAS